MNTDVVSAGVQTFIACCVLETLIWLAFLAGTGNGVAALFYSVWIGGPVSCWLAPFMYNRLRASNSR